MNKEFYSQNYESVIIIQKQKEEDTEGFKQKKEFVNYV